jgi:hypothetical protein
MHRLILFISREKKKSNLVVVVVVIDDTRGGSERAYPSSQNGTIQQSYVPGRIVWSRYASTGTSHGDGCDGSMDGRSVASLILGI